MTISNWGEELLGRLRTRKISVCLAGRGTNDLFTLTRLRALWLVLGFHVYYTQLHQCCAIMACVLMTMTCSYTEEQDYEKCGIWSLYAKSRIACSIWEAGLDLNEVVGSILKLVTVVVIELLRPGSGAGPIFLHIWHCMQDAATDFNILHLA